MKKKLEGVYIPDKKGRKEKVVLGLSGGIDSYVTAYLLKIQKYDLIAVTVASSWDELATTAPENVLSCHLNQAKLDKIKDFCHTLKIPLHIIKSSMEFKEHVIDPWVDSKITGMKTRPCWNCHELRMNLIYEKMKEVGADKIATGHYAKLFHHENHGSVFVHTSNDELNDQSAFLSRLKHDVLSRMLLPLSDLTKKEVLKLAENFGLINEEKAIATHQCLKDQEELITILQKKIPEKLIKEGEITSLNGMESYGQHEGVHTFEHGETFEFKENGKPEKGVIVGYSYSEKRVLIADSDYLMRNKLLLTKCTFSEEVTWPEPVKGFAVLSQNEVIDCWIHPKSLSSVFLEFEEPQKVSSGEIISVIKKKGRNSKILLTGQVQLLPLEPAKEEGEESVPKVKVNHGLDF